MERTFTMVKPDGVQKGMIGEIISRFEKKGIMMQITKEMAEEHYAEHKEKPFFAELVSFITSGPVAAMVLEGENVISTVRTMMGATNPRDAAPGTIRGDFAMTMSKNIIHGSDSPASASREIKIFFSEEEVLTYKKAGEEWV
jgi:nucleoside-diphosphate kinase